MAEREAGGWWQGPDHSSRWVIEMVVSLRDGSPESHHRSCESQHFPDARVQLPLIGAAAKPPNASSGTPMCEPRRAPRAQANGQVTHARYDLPLNITIVTHNCKRLRHISTTDVSFLPQSLTRPLAPLRPEIPIKIPDPTGNSHAVGPKTRSDSRLLPAIAGI